MKDQKKRRIVLVRHGESTTNREKLLTGRGDPDLTFRGIRQARVTARYLRKTIGTADAYYTSPLGRSLQTACIIAGGDRRDVIQDDLLIETDFGDWEGLGREELERWPEWQSYAQDPFHFTFPGGESPQKVRNRVLTFRERLYTDPGWSSVVVVSHYTPIAFYLLEVIGGGNGIRAAFRVDNSSVSIVSSMADAEMIELLNYQPH
jgi:broad specificity phosphatase PhoE